MHAPDPALNFYKFLSPKCVFYRKPVLNAIFVYL